MGSIINLRRKHFNSVLLDHRWLAMATKADLEQYHTRQLLRLKNYLHHGNNEYESYLPWEILERLRDDLKAILATREHIPNKKESKVIRRLASVRSNKRPSFVNHR